MQRLWHTGALASERIQKPDRARSVRFASIHLALAASAGVLARHFIRDALSTRSPMKPSTGYSRVRAIIAAAMFGGLSQISGAQNLAGDMALSLVLIEGQGWQ